jgi:hypothetical protein
VDGVKGAQEQVGFDHGGAHDFLVDLDVLEGVEQALGVGDEGAPMAGHRSGSRRPTEGSPRGVIELVT